MSAFYEFEDVDAFTTGAIGQPGSRVFFLQARHGGALPEAEAHDAEDVRAFLGHLHGLGLARKTLGRKLAAVRSFFRFLNREGLLEASPAAQIPTPKTPERLPPHLSVDGIQLLLDTPDPATDRVGIACDRCQDGYYGTGEACSKCDGAAQGASVILILIVPFVMVCIYRSPWTRAGWMGVRGFLFEHRDICCAAFAPAVFRTPTGWHGYGCSSGGGESFSLTLVGGFVASKNRSEVVQRGERAAQGGSEASGVLTEHMYIHISCTS